MKNYKNAIRDGLNVYVKVPSIFFCKGCVFRWSDAKFGKEERWRTKMCDKINRSPTICSGFIYTHGSLFMYFMYLIGQVLWNIIYGNREQTNQD